MVTTRVRLYNAAKLITQAVAVVEADTGASPMLLAAVEELRKKSKNAIGAMNCANDDVFEQIIAMEQAADSVEHAAEAERGLTGETRKKVLEAHMSAIDVRCCRG